MSAGINPPPIEKDSFIKPVYKAFVATWAAIDRGDLTLVPLLESQAKTLLTWCLPSDEAWVKFDTVEAIYKKLYEEAWPQLEGRASSYKDHDKAKAFINQQLALLRFDAISRVMAPIKKMLEKSPWFREFAPEVEEISKGALKATPIPLPPGATP